MLRSYSVKAQTVIVLILFYTVVLYSLIRSKSRLSDNFYL